jgi:hypothetical protein
VSRLNEWYTDFYFSLPSEDQKRLTLFLAKRRVSTIEYTERRMRVNILRSLGLNGRGECRHCKVPTFCKHGGLTESEDCE